MLKNTLIQHRAERDRLLGQRFVPRSGLEAARALVGNGLVKVITGPRRAGKSVFALQMLGGADFAYVNFDDERLVSLSDYDDLVAGLAEVYLDTRRLLFDEIQNLPRWELFVNRLQRRGYDLVLTGSNANMLAGEMATALTGRYAGIEILPFSFTECLKAWDSLPSRDDLVLPEVRGRTLRLLDRYLTDGGFPEVAVKGLPAREYLSTLVDAVLFKDEVRRYAVREEVV